MALQVAERAVVRQHVEAVVDALERPARLVPAVAAPADVRVEHGGPLLLAHRVRERVQPVVGQVGRRVQGGRDHLLLSERVVLGERHDVARPRLRPGRVLRGDVGDVLARLAQVVRPRDAAIGQVDALQERGDHLAQLGERLDQV